MVLGFFKKGEKVPEAIADNVEPVLSEQEEIANAVNKIEISNEKSSELFWTWKSPEKKAKSKYFFWYPPDQSSYEKKLIFKLDVAIMTYVCLAYFTRYLDAQNVATAYISGMKEDLEITGEQYVWIVQLFGVGYSLSGALTTVLLTRVRFSRLVPFMEFMWGLMCLFVFLAQNFQTIAALRFLQGFCEGCAWPAIHYALGSWYTSQELGKRTAIFIASGPVGTILSGLIQAGLQRSMDGHAGLAGWRWLFIIDAVITFPVAIYGFFIFPDTPDTAKPKFYLSQEDIDYLKDRMKVNGGERVNDLDMGTFKRVFQSYQWYVFVFAWILWNYASVITGYLGIVLMDLGYDVYDRNNIPTAIQGFGIATCLITGFIIDASGGRRVEVAAVSMLTWIVGLIMIKIYDMSVAGLIIGYVLTGASAAVSPIIVGWCNELCKEDNAKRAAVIGSLNFVAGLLSVPWALKLFNADMGPKFTKGTIGCLVVGIMLFFQIFLIYQFERYQNRKRDYVKSLVSQDASEIESGQSFEILSDEGKGAPVVTSKEVK